MIIRLRNQVILKDLYMSFWDGTLMKNMVPNGIL